MKLFFILGSPRSGTTLLRTLLGSHSQVFSLSETPWVTGCYGPQSSLLNLRRYLSEHKLGLVNNCDLVTPQMIDQSIQRFVNGLSQEILSVAEKDCIVFKTPDDIRFVEELAEMLPDAQFIHIKRDPRDVSLSTFGRFDKLSGYGEATHENILSRWLHFENNIADFSKKNNERIISTTYENLVTKPDLTLKEICKFMGLGFEKSMVNYGDFKHDFPSWEHGSNDVASKGTIDSDSVSKWRTKALSIEAKVNFEEFNKVISQHGYHDFDINVTPKEKKDYYRKLKFRSILQNIRSKLKSFILLVEKNI